MAKILNVHESVNNVLTESVVNGINTNNVIASNPSTPYTATEDCYATFNSGSNTKTVYIDGVQVHEFYASGSSGIFLILPVKKGQIITTAGTTAAVVIRQVFGIKR